MALTLLRQALSLILNSVCIWTMSQIMNMRSQRLFLVSSILGSVVCQALFILRAPDVLPLIIGLITYGFGFPLCMSTGPMHTRVLRTILVNVAAMTCESGGRTLYVLLTGTGFPRSMDGMPIPSMLATFALTGILDGLLCAAIIAVCQWTDHDRNYPIDIPIVVLLFWSCFICLQFFLWCSDSIFSSLGLTVTQFVYCMLAVVLALCTMILAHTDARASRRKANELASKEQISRMRVELAESARRSLELRRLRHDMANQVAVVDELVKHGRMTDADAYLAQLQQRAHALTQDK